MRSSLIDFHTGLLHVIRFQFPSVAFRARATVVIDNYKQTVIITVNQHGEKNCNLFLSQA